MDINIKIDIKLARIHNDLGTLLYDQKPSPPINAIIQSYPRTPQHTSSPLNLQREAKKIPNERIAFK